MVGWGAAPARRSLQPEAATARANENRVEPDVAADSTTPVNPPLISELKLDPAHPYLKEHGLSTAVIRPPQHG